MKTNYIISMVSAVLLMVGLSACDGDDNSSVVPMPAEQQKSPITFDTDTVVVGVHETTTFKITDGGGEYKVVNENPNIVTATVNGSVVTVASKRRGLTAIIVSDAKGEYKRITVKSMYFKMLIDKESLSVGMKLGHTDGIGYVTVTEGNGSYEAVSEDEKIAKVSQIRGDTTIVVQGVSTGTTNITVTDLMGLTKTFSVTVQTTTIPYTEEEKAELLKVTKNTIQFDGQSASDWGTFTVNPTGNPKIGWDYYGYEFRNINFDGDLSVGKKKNGSYSQKSYWGGSGQYDNMDIEILKNDGTRVWGIMSVIKDDYLHYGYFSVAL
ncbi:hypothetical protein CJ231_09535 [Hoylesella buccalis]|uniref:Uncharacterized protein n=1 Tax=Hoylesella buccalis TaxID=28127 RepID=A0A2N6QPB6_9BACT|nr:pilus assembly protein N-terminal domain-containing protein [Hoylesella buccalis]PMC23481.1 hypothetical protein CJ231_09535 [Hoylesella buccalis]